MTAVFLTIGWRNVVTVAQPLNLWVHSLVHQLHWHDWAEQVRFATLKHLHVSGLWGFVDR